MTKTQRENLERMHRQIIRLCFGCARSTDSHMEENSLDTLERRRVESTRWFTRKIIHSNPRFREKWLIPGNDDEHGLRNRRPFVETRSKTNRYFNSPLLYIQRVANNLMTEWILPVLKFDCEMYPITILIDNRTDTDWRLCTYVVYIDFSFYSPYWLLNHYGDRFCRFLFSRCLSTFIIVLVYVNL